MTGAGGERARGGGAGGRGSSRRRSRGRRRRHGRVSGNAGAALAVLAAAAAMAVLLAVALAFSYRQSYYIPATFGERRLFEYASIPVMLVALAAVETGVADLPRLGARASAVVAAAMVVLVVAAAGRVRCVATSRRRRDGGLHERRADRDPVQLPDPADGHEQGGVPGADGPGRHPRGDGAVPAPVDPAQHGASHPRSPASTWLTRMPTPAFCRPSTSTTCWSAAAGAGWPSFATRPGPRVRAPGGLRARLPPHRPRRAAAEASGRATHPGTHADGRRFRERPRRLTRAQALTGGAVVAAGRGGWPRAGSRGRRRSRARPAPRSPPLYPRLPAAAPGRGLGRGVGGAARPARVRSRRRGGLRRSARARGHGRRPAHAGAPARPRCAGCEQLATFSITTPPSVPACCSEATGRSSSSASRPRAAGSSSPPTSANGGMCWRSGPRSPSRQTRPSTSASAPVRPACRRRCGATATPSRHPRSTPRSAHAEAAAACCSCTRATCTPAGCSLIATRSAPTARSHRRRPTRSWP